MLKCLVYGMTTQGWVPFRYGCADVGIQAWARHRHVHSCAHNWDQCKIEDVIWDFKIVLCGAGWKLVRMPQAGTVQRRARRRTCGPWFYPAVTHFVRSAFPREFSLPASTALNCALDV